MGNGSLANSIYWEETGTLGVREIRERNRERKERERLGENPEIWGDKKDPLEREREKVEERWGKRKLAIG